MTEADRIATLEGSVDKLKEKVQALQNIAWVLGGLAAALGLGGAGLWTTLSSLRTDANQVKTDLQTTSDGVKKLNSNLAEQVAAALAPQLTAARLALTAQERASIEAISSEVVVANNCMLLTSAQICWGSASLTPEPSAPHTAAFSFNFGRSFADTPVVTATPSVNGSGHMLGIYSWSANKSMYSGRVNNVYLKERLSEPLTMTYVAIGQPKR